MAPRGGSDYGCFLLSFSCSTRVFFISDPSGLAPTVVGLIAIIFQRKIKRAGGFRAQAFVALDNGLHVGLWLRANTGRIDGEEATGAIN